MLRHHEMVTEREVPDVIRRRLVAGAAEWQRLGLTQARLRSLTRSGDLARVWHGVYTTRPAVEWAKTNPARGHALLVMAACAAVGRDSTASHQSAALIHGLDLFPAAPNMVFLTRPPTRRSGRLRSDGIFFHTAELPDEHVTKIFGTRVTTVARTVVDLARTSSFQSAVVTADSALRAELTTKAALASVCAACL
jgi:predicted transcriptional regulator of viral defense system